MEVLRPLLILFLFCGLLLSITYLFHASLKYGRRLSLLQAFMVVGMLVWFITEVLGLFKAITFAGLVSSWGIVFLIALTMVYRISGGNFKKAILNEVRDVQERLLSVPKGLLAILICTFIGMVVLGLIAFVAAPNTWDSMTYHLSRVMHWEQNQSLDFYPTSIERQLHLGPFAEMAILNFQILAGNDHLANFVQFFAMIGCLVGVSWITKMLGGNAYAQVFSVTAVATLPMGVLQSTSTQNDYVAALWLICFISLLLKQMDAEEHSWVLSFLIGVSLGLAFLTKSTTLLFGAFFGLWFTYVVYKKIGMKIWKNLVILLGVALIISVSHSFRNYHLYGNPLGPLVESGLDKFKITNDSYGFSVLTSNVSRNMAIHLALPFESYNNGVERAMLQLHAILDVDINDSRTTWTGTEFQVNYSTNENLAGNPFHLLLIIISVFSLSGYRKDQLIIFTICLIMGFLSFSLFLKWQPWHSRLHLPMFVLALPLAGLIVSRYLNPQRLYLWISVLYILSIPVWIQNPSRPLIGDNNILLQERIRQYFAHRPEYYESYASQSEAISKMECEKIGLMVNVDDMEYPIWVMTKAYGRNDIHFEHILVDNVSGKLANDFAPCAILSTYPLQGKIIEYQGREFVRVREEEHLGLFVLTDTQP